MKRRDLFRAATHLDGPRSIRYDDWPALTGGRAVIRRHGTIIQTGTVGYGHARLVRPLARQ